jgi:AraC-like DNA-binding protein
MKIIDAFICNAEPGYTAEHEHPFWELSVTAGGGGTAFHGAAEEPFSPGDIFLVPPGLPHSKRSEGPWRDMVLHVENFLPGRESAVKLADAEAGTCARLADAVIGMGDGTARSLAAEALRRFILEKAGSTGSYTAPKNRDVGLVAAALVENFTNPEYKTADALAIISYNKEYFRQCFEEETGVTPAEYLHDLRLGHAAVLLKQRSVHKLNVSEAAAASGFYDNNYFTRVFKKKFGVPPSAYYSGVRPEQL